VTYSDGQTATSNTVKVVDETVTTNFAWKYQSNEKWYSIFTSFFGVLNNGSVTWDVPLSFSWYYSALSSSVPRAAGYDSLEKYVTYADPTIRSMAQGLLSYTSGMSDIDRVNFVLKFVQSLPYQYDIKGKGVDEYWKLPAETLWEGKGDCEDHAFLFASLIKAMGYKVALHYIYCYEGGKFIGAHLAVGVAVPGGSGSYLAINGVKYYYCEATAEVGTSWINDYNVGHQPSGYVIQQTWIV
jgi:predicted transglutaminase-like cysteine proteinase